MPEFAKDPAFLNMESQGFFRLDIPEELNMARLAVDYWAEQGRAEEVAVYHKDRNLTYGELKELTDRFAAALQGLGIAKGERYVIRTPNQPEFPIAFLGGQKIGAVPIPTNVMFRESELEHIVNDSQSVAVITTPAYVQAVNNIRAKCRSLKFVVTIGQAEGDQILFEDLLKSQGAAPSFVKTGKEDPAFFLYTSGTTGPPKGVVHCHRWIIGTGDPIGKFVLGLARGEICGGPTPLTWMYALGDNFLFPLRWGAATAIYPEERFDPEQAFAFVERYKITVFSGSPTIYRMMLAIEDAEQRYDLSSLKYCISSGEPLLAETWREWMRRFGVKIQDSMGQTEAHIFCSTQMTPAVKIGSMGKPLPGVEVAVVNDQGERLGPGQEGNLAIRKDYPGLFKEYHKMPGKMAEVSLPNNWYCTKDLAYYDEDGYFWYVSRSDDIITSRGYRISPAEVETALQEHPAVLESGVASAPDEAIGEKVKAWVVLHQGHQPTAELAQKLQQHVKSTIAPYKYPREIEFVGELPKTITGKILRKELRRVEQEKAAAHPSA